MMTTHQPWNERRFTRFCARYHVRRSDLLLIGLFLLGHPEMTFVRSLLAFVRGEGPAAIAAGRARVV